MHLVGDRRWMPLIKWEEGLFRKSNPSHCTLFFKGKDTNDHKRVCNFSQAHHHHHRAATQVLGHKQHRC